MQILVLDVRVVIWGSLQPAYILGYTSIIILSPARKRKRTRGLPQKNAVRVHLGRIERDCHLP